MKMYARKFKIAIYCYPSLCNLLIYSDLMQILPLPKLLPNCYPTTTQLLPNCYPTSTNDTVNAMRRGNLVDALVIDWHSGMSVLMENSLENLSVKRHLAG